MQSKTRRELISLIKIAIPLLGLSSVALAEMLQTDRSGRARRRDPGEIMCRDGHRVRSIAEKRIDEHLSRLRIPHQYEPRIPGTTGNGLFSDFLLTRANIFIEYWGSEDAEYLARRRQKLALYRKAGHEPIELWPRHWNYIESALEQKLREREVL